MYLNTHPHFMAAKGFKKYGTAEKKLSLAVAAMRVKPLRFVLTRPINDTVDYVAVVVLTPENMVWATHLAARNIYCTSA